MATAARDRLGRMLRGGAQAAVSVELTARTGDLSLEVEGFGPVRFPVTPAKARKLAGLGRPAEFGRGELTLTDPDVRDTWEIPRHLVRAGWNDATLKDVLATVKEELGLPNAAELTADLHSLLVYEQNQHFLTHQDSEKDDAMIGTLVVTLPSGYTGGELMVGHNEEWKAYRGSKTALSLVAFYADCRHEVLRVNSGYRITLTYNLLLHGDTSRPDGDDGTAAELADLLREHFSTPVPRYYSGPAADPPNRLVYLLDHEYTPRGLTWRRLKGADARRVSLLRAAAGQTGCEAVLALAGPEQRARLERIQATMTLVEGYAEHVMDAADPDRLRERAVLRARLARRREGRGGLGEAIARMLGLELKLRQYRLGKSFCDRVVAERGMAVLNQAWSEPAAMPSPAELEHPDRWLARVAPVAA